MHTEVVIETFKLFIKNNLYKSTTLSLKQGLHKFCLPITSPSHMHISVSLT